MGEPRKVRIGNKKNVLYFMIPGVGGVSFRILEFTFLGNILKKQGQPQPCNLKTCSNPS